MTNCSSCGLVNCVCTVQAVTVVVPSPVVVGVVNSAQGVTGIQGPAGIQGTQGLQGTQGVQGFYGGGLWTSSLTPPANPSFGDRWFNLNNGLEYTWIFDGNSNQWVDTRTSGYVGPTGIQGTQGIQGVQGTQGVQGNNGVQGITGTQGTQGLIGIQGATGTQGLVGIQGTQGLQGTIGSQGVAGPTAAIAATAPVTYNSGTQTVALNIGSSLTTSASNLIVDSTVVPYLANANTFTASPQQITVNAAGNKGLIVIGAASQTANLQEWQNSASTAVASITPLGIMQVPQINSVLSGKAFMQTNGDTNGFLLNTNALANKGLVIRASPSQTANLQEWQNSAGTALSWVGSNGSIVSQGTIYVNGNSIIDVYGTTSGTRIRSTISANAVVLTSFGNANQTGDMFQLVNSSSTVLSGVNAAGQIYAGTTASVVGSTTTALTSAAYTSATVAVFTYGGTSLVQAGQTVTVAGVSGGTYNGTWVVSAVTSTTFTVLGSGFTNVAGTGGTFALSAVGSFVAGTAAITPLVVQGAASQTANIQEWQNSAGAVISRVTSSGSYLTVARLSAGSTTTATANINSYISSPSLIGIIVQGAASQTADLQQLQTSAGTILGGANALAQIYTGSTSPILVATGSATTAASGDGTTATITTTSAHGLAVGDLVTVAGVTPTGYNATAIVTVVGSTTTFSYLNATTGAQTVAGTVSAPAQSSVTARSAGTAGLVIKGAASQTADLLQLQDSTAAVKIKMGVSGTISAGFFGEVNSTGAYIQPVSGDAIYVFSRTATNKGLIVKGVASQTANLQEWQNSAGTVLSYIDSAGNMNFSNTGSFAQSSTGRALFVVNGTTNVPIIAKGAASQTADLTQWQNSAGTVLTSILAAGTINFASGNTATTATAGAITAPSLVAGYITMQIAGTTVKVPYYSN